MAREANWNDWDLETMRPYLDRVFDLFGPERIVYGSDWPVCLLATSYEQWLSTIGHYCEALSLAEQERVFHGTARSVYGLGEE